jgi:hypothetical protein
LLAKNYLLKSRRTAGGVGAAVWVAASASGDKQRQRCGRVNECWWRRFEIPSAI